MLAKKSSLGNDRKISKNGSTEGYEEKLEDDNNDGLSFGSVEDEYDIDGCSVSENDVVNELDDFGHNYHGRSDGNIELMIPDSTKEVSSDNNGPALTSSLRRPPKILFNASGSNVSSAGTSMSSSNFPLKPSSFRSNRNRDNSSSQLTLDSLSTNNDTMLEHDRTRRISFTTDVSANSVNTNNTLISNSASANTCTSSAADIESDIEDEDDDEIDDDDLDDDSIDDADLERLKNLYGDGAGLGATPGGKPTVSRRASFSSRHITGSSVGVSGVSTGHHRNVSSRTLMESTSGRFHHESSLLGHIHRSDDHKNDGNHLHSLRGKGVAASSSRSAFSQRLTTSYRKSPMEKSTSESQIYTNQLDEGTYNALSNMNADYSAWESTEAAAKVAAAALSGNKTQKRFKVGDKVLVDLNFLNAAVLGDNNTFGQGSNRFSVTSSVRSIDTTSSQVYPRPPNDNFAAGTFNAQYGAGRGRRENQRNEEQGKELRASPDSSSTHHVRNTEEGGSQGQQLSRSQVDAMAAQILARSTVAPVNKVGFPQGQGKTDDEKKGPFVYVLATVAKVHFEEDDRYYTVTRADTRTPQRADTDWMQQIASGSEGEKAAENAAQRRRDNQFSDKDKQPSNSQGVYAYMKLARGCYNHIGRHCVSCYHTSLRIMKEQARLFLNGNPPYACQIKFTTVNVLVLCSFIFMFIDQVRLAFFPYNYDFGVGVVSFIVWIILVLELMFEILIRPDGYSTLIVSERAYAPSTARFINRFHLVSETISLALFAPEIATLSSSYIGQAYSYSLIQASLWKTIGPNRAGAVFGTLYFAAIRLRVFGVVRHWKNMWINHTFDNRNQGMLHGFLMSDYKSNGKKNYGRSNKKKDDDNENDHAYDTSEQMKVATTETTNRLNKAATIGTALMVVNSHRAMVLLVMIVGFMPVLYTATSAYGFNDSDHQMTKYLHTYNTMLKNNDTESCEYLETAYQSWFGTDRTVKLDRSIIDVNNQVLWAQILPPRCNFQDTNGVITFPEQSFCESEQNTELCNTWSKTVNKFSTQGIASVLNMREGATVQISNYEVLDGTIFNTTVVFNESHTISVVNISSFLMQLSVLCLVIIGLTVLRGDASRLVIYPLRRMLKIVLRYAENPLSPAPIRSGKKGSGESNKRENEDDSDYDFDDETDRLGSYETEQLITTIAKITDLLRKCWGVAGAGIISANLARKQDGDTVVFNPTVPGKLVYAVFGFAGINDFTFLLRCLDQQVMILINNVATVVHSEVFRWGLGDRGQCNKNLGAAFLMVYRIGDFLEVQEKKEKATDVLFKPGVKKHRRKTENLRKRKGPRRSTRRKQTRPNLGFDILQLASLPGICDFTDRALLGLLKSFAGIHRDKSLRGWKNDLRLGAGVGAHQVEMIFGMDAGWAVEGAVGSGYKIDATYLSPHVNMASRMMTACKQYGLSILLSRAVEELLSEPARAKLRHIDTVLVKGSSIKQRIYTYDSRQKGLNFFLYERSPEQADADSDNYSPEIWEKDQDLKAMRCHVSDDFVKTYNDGRECYLDGQWSKAIKKLKEANNLMIETVRDEGCYESDVADYIDQVMDPNCQLDFIVALRQSIGDGPCQSLVSYMEKEMIDGKAPANWDGVRNLISK